MMEDEAMNTIEAVMEQPDLFALGAPEVDGARTGRSASVTTNRSRETKKDRILAMWRDGTREIDRLAALSNSRPSYVASVLQSAGLLRGYFDLYTTTNQDQNAYSRFFRGVLEFRTVEAARESVAKIDRLYKYFERIGDRAGQHHAEVMALTGRNRARWGNKKECAQVFMNWLVDH
jgi:hypothetical protein